MTKPPRCVALLIAGVALSGCQSASKPKATPLPTQASPSASPTLAPLVPDHGRVVLLDVHTGTGSTTLPVKTFKGAFELLFSCIGAGKMTIQVGDNSNVVPCDGSSLANEVQTLETARTLTLTAGASQSWRVLVQQGHTQIG